MTNRSYDFTLGAVLGANQRLDVRGSFLRVLSAPGGPVGIKLDGGAEFELADGQGWRLPPGQEFRDVVVRNLQAVANAGRVFIGDSRLEDTRMRRLPVLLMETGVNPVAAGSGPGWVSGDVASLAASAVVNVVFDLGPDWQQYGVLELTVDPRGPSSGLNPVIFYGSDTTAANTSRRRGPLSATGISAYFANFTSAAGCQLVTMRPAGRYLIVAATNADGANPLAAASKVTLQATPVMNTSVVVVLGLLVALAIAANRRADLADLVDGGAPSTVSLDVDPDYADPSAPTEEQGQGGAALAALPVLAALDPTEWWSYTPDPDMANLNRDAFLKMIRMAEGTAGSNGYRTLFGGQLFDGWADHPRRAVQFTDKLQRKLWTSAAGAYQFMAVSPIPGGFTKVDTWDRLQAKLELPDFSPMSQDLAALELVRECGALDDVDAGRVTEAVTKCRRVWASLPGAGYAQNERSMSSLLAAYTAAGGALA